MSLNLNPFRPVFLSAIHRPKPFVVYLPQTWARTPIRHCYSRNSLYHHKQSQGVLSSVVLISPHTPIRYFHSHSSNSSQELQSSVAATALLVAVSLAVGTFFAWETITTSSTDSETRFEDDKQDLEGTFDAEMPHANTSEAEILPGRPGNLTPEQDAKLRELWYKMGELIGLDVQKFSADYNLSFPSNDDAASVAPSSVSRRSKFRRFGRNKEKTSDNDKHGSNKEFKNAISDLSHEELREALWDFAKCDDPDANLCRYLRARKWVVQDALVMLVSTIYWRKKSMHLDDDVMVNGEEAAMRAVRGETTGTGGLSTQLAHDMLVQLRLGKSYMHGTDKGGRPICFIRVKLHHGGEFSPESLERLTVSTIETARFMLDPPRLETAALLFDMSGFSMANMDYTPLKFIIKVFEANYPESLGVVLVHRAPWIFQSVWSVIKGWLDPVVASKINFTKDVNDLTKYIDLDNIPLELGGEEDWEYEYPEPIDGENAKMDDHATRDKLLAERRELLDQFEAATMQWVLKNGQNDSQERSRRASISKQLYTNYWKMDPYVRARSMYDRLGVIGDNGETNPYPKSRPQWAQNGVTSLPHGDSEKMPPPPTYDGSNGDAYGNGGINGVAAGGATAAAVAARSYSQTNSKPFQRQPSLNVPPGISKVPGDRSSVASIYFDATSERE